MRVEYEGKSLDEIGVGFPGEPPLRYRPEYTERFDKPRHNRDVDLMIEDIPETIARINREAHDADVLWYRTVDVAEEDGEPFSVNGDEIVVVIVNERCIQNPKLRKWLERMLSATPDSPSIAHLFVPEHQGGKRAAGVKRLYDKGWYDIRVTAYFPTFVK